jgi:hypothetical protein
VMQFVPRQHAGGIGEIAVSVESSVKARQASRLSWATGSVFKCAILQSAGSMEGIAGTALVAVLPL